MTRRLRCLALSDFNLANLAGYLANDPSSPQIEVLETPFGQVFGPLAQGAGGRTPEPDFALVWTRPEAMIATFRRLLEGEHVETADLMAEVEDHIDRLARVVEGVPFALVPTWTLSSDRAAFASLDMKTGIGADAALLRMNLRLVERLGETPGIHVLNAEAWMRGSQAYSPKLWYLSKIPFGNEVFRRAVATIKASLRGVLGAARKLLVVDLDDTLWGGLVGEVGWERLVLGGHDPVGEAFVDFQRGLRKLRRRGVLLGIVSKNDEEVALEAIRRHPEMVLGLDDFAGWRINWQDKARNLVDLVEELNLGLQSVVFVDDSAAERARVAEALPEVVVPDWPADKLMYRHALDRLECFDNPALTREDAERTVLYASERRRREARRDVGSLDEWLETLETRVVVEPLDAANLTRAAQLLNKTNQMNLATRRMSESELGRWAEAEGRVVWTFRVSDRFGDAGLTGLVGLEEDGDAARLTDFVLSCRVFGRKVEETMLAVAIEHAQSRGLRELRATYRPTARNRPCLEFLRRSGMTEAEPGAAGSIAFIWSCDTAYPRPSHVQVVEAGGGEPEATAPAHLARGAG